ncbi:MAG TPA: S8 family serine peptidase [Prolixibacteraceae bacterium]|nr:S8 family serine peptidase [Prolixibacteraceae bacterium]
MRNFFPLCKTLSHFLLVLLVFGLIFGCQEELQEPTITDKQSPLELKSAKNANFMVISTSETLPSGFEKKLSPYGQVVKSMPEIGIVVIKPTSANFELVVSKIEGVSAVVPDLTVKWIEPTQFVTASRKFLKAANPPSIGSNEPYFFYEWGMDAIDAPEAWNAGYKGKNARVFILDSGIDAEHPDLAPNLNKTLSTSFVPGEGYNIASGSYFNHGTHVAGTIAAADNDYGVIGVAPEAEIVAVKVLSEYNGSGDFSWVNEGIVYAANNGADVINMSLGATFARNGFYLDENGVLQKTPAVYLQRLILAQQRAVNYAYGKGAVIVVSAGNEAHNSDGDAYIYKLPAELQNVIAVSATAPNYWYRDLMNGVTDPLLDIPASYTNFGKSLVAIGAPGGDFDFAEQTNWYWDMVLSTSSEGFSWAAGTSMASPHVAGVAALVIAKNGGSMRPHEVTAQLLKTADKIDGSGISAFYGKGRVNAFRAVTE